MVQASVGWHCPECVRDGARSSPVIRWRSSGRPTALGGRITPITGLLIAINVAVFVWNSGDRQAIYHFGMVPLLIRQGQWYRLITAIFFHFNLLHIGLNMVMLAIIGPPVERDLGKARFLALYLLAGFGGEVCSYLVSPLDVLGAGASGAIFGLFGAYLLLARRTKTDMSSAVVLIVVNLLYSFLQPDIDWRAHIGGLIVGLVVAAGYAAGRGQARVTGLGRATGLRWIAGLGAGGGRQRVAVLAAVITSAATLAILIELARLPPGHVNL